MSKGRQRLVLALSAAVIASPAAAATSMTSVTGIATTYALGGPPSYQKLNSYNGARIYSEDGRAFYVRAFGCEFTVEEPLAQNDLGEQLVRLRKQKWEGLAVPNQVTWYYVSRLLNPHPYTFAETGPQQFQCNGTMVSEVDILRERWNPNEFQMKVLQFNLRTMHLDAEYLFVMNKDVFTPKQASEAWDWGGAIGLAIFKALAK